MANKTVTIQQNGPQTPVAGSEGTRGVVFTPRCDIVETEEDLVLMADLPGVKPEDLDLRFENGELMLHGRCWPRQAQGKFVGGEYEVGDFHRVFSVSEDINSDKIRAELKNGELTVHLPKSEKAKPRKIAVRGS